MNWKRDRGGGLSVYRCSARREFPLWHYIEGLHRRIILKWILGEYSVRMWIEFIRLRIETSGGLL
jgi:hypothetical protein